MKWTPTPKQKMVLQSRATEILYGGAAGGGKTDLLIVLAARGVAIPGYNAILFRRTNKELLQADGLVERSQQWYTELGGVFNRSRLVWTFPSGATVRFSYLYEQDDKYKHKSAQYSFIGFDELTQIPWEDAYLYLLSRLRTRATLRDGRPWPVQIVGCTNPEGPGFAWVRDRWKPWVLGDVPPGKLLYFARDPVSGLERQVPPGTFGAVSRTFIPATIEDNPYLLKNNPQYVNFLSALDPVTRQRLLEGRWDAGSEGALIKRHWLQTAKSLPDDLVCAVGWDLAVSTKTTADNTAWVCVCRSEAGDFYLIDGDKGKWSWPQQRTKILDICRRYPHAIHGIEKKLHGIAAVQELGPKAAEFGVVLRGVDVAGDKVSRAALWINFAEAGHLFIYPFPRLGKILEDWVAFDGKTSGGDDAVDAMSVAMHILAGRTFGVGVVHNPKPEAGETIGGEQWASSQDFLDALRGQRQQALLQSLRR